MKTSDFKDRWEQFRNQKGFFQRIDPNHPMDFFIGISERGYDELMLLTVQEPAQLKSSRFLEITKNQRPKDKKWATQICSLDIKNQDIFARLCIDLLESSQDAKTEQDGLGKVTRRFLAWQKLFASLNSGLPQHVLKGLVGELSFAKEVLSYHYSWDEIMMAWLGPDGADRDYIFPDKWFEIKAVATGKDKVSISSLNQLDTSDLGYLVKFDVDESSATDPNAISVSNMINSVREIMASYPNASHVFEQKLISLGYIDRPDYDNIYYSHKLPVYYLVNEQFPRLVPATVPAEVVGASYDLSLVGIDEWKKDEVKIWN